MRPLAFAFRDYRHSVLLALLLFMNFVQPAARGIWGGLLGFDVFLTLVLIGVVLIIFRQRDERVIAVILAMPAVIARWATYGLSGRDHLVASAIHHGSIAIFFGFAIFVILRGVFDEKVVKADHFIGTVCGYLLAGAAWGSCYMLADLLADNAFSIKTELAWQLRDDDFRSFLFNYFSLCTLDRGLVWRHYSDGYQRSYVHLAGGGLRQVLHRRGGRTAGGHQVRPARDVACRATSYRITLEYAVTRWQTTDAITLAPTS